jgi:hypothetical protein
MTAWLPTSSRLKFDDLNVSTQPFADAPGRLRRMLRTVGEMLTICSRAQAAAQHYEDLKPMSNADLAERGLDRADVPRAAFRKLTEEK